MKMLNLVCKKDFLMNPDYEGASQEISYKAGKSYVFLKIGNRYFGFDESQTCKHELWEEHIKEHFFSEVLGVFDVTDAVLSVVEKSLKN